MGTNLKCQQLQRKPIERQPARLKKDEMAVQDLETCMVEFDAESFDESKPTLHSLQSGLVASPELVADLRSALQDGKTQV